MYIGAVENTGAVGELGQSVHLGSVYTGAVCTLGQFVHWVCLYTEAVGTLGAVCTLGQCVHWSGRYDTWPFHSVYWCRVGTGAGEMIFGLSTRIVYTWAGGMMWAY